MDRRVNEFGRPVNLIANYDNFELRRPAAARFFEMVRDTSSGYF